MSPIPPAHERVGAIVVAAGAGRRMRGQDKLWLNVGDRPVLGHALAVFAAMPEIAQIVVVTSAASQHRLASLAEQPPYSAVTAVVLGGPERADSVYNGLLALAACDIVLVHDAARPCVSARLVRAGIAAARETGAAIPVVPVSDTIKVVDARGVVASTPDRAALRAVQTPQVFSYALLREAHEAAAGARGRYTDDAALVERLGVPVATFPGDPRNLKLTCPEDLPLLAHHLTSLQAEQGAIAHGPAAVP